MHDVDRMPYDPIKGQGHE